MRPARYGMSPSRPGLRLAFAVALAAWAPGLARGQVTDRDREIRTALEELRDAVLKSGRVGRPGKGRALTLPTPRDSVGLIPLDELGTGTYQGKQGGLYPGGSNTRPARHEKAGVELARTVRPLDASGKPLDAGKVVLLSIGMSNATQEFSTFKRLADVDPEKSPALVIVDGAQGGMTADVIVAPENPRFSLFWQTVNDRLAAGGVSEAQVQVVWVKEAVPGPTAKFPDDALSLQADLARIARVLKRTFPNLRLAYYSSRIYGGYATTPLNPEPFAYQSGFAVKWLIEAQIEGAADLNFDPARGAVKAPWLSWGPYLWADGIKRRRDGLAYVRADFAADGTHPAPKGAREKVAQRLLEFFKTDATTRPWFVAPKGDDR